MDFSNVTNAPKTPVDLTGNLANFVRGMDALEPVAFGVARLE